MRKFTTDSVLEWAVNHFPATVAIVLIGTIVFSGCLTLVCDMSSKHFGRWNGWMRAHQMEYVEGLKYNIDKCIGNNADKYATIRCLEPPTFYKNYWVWKHF